MRKNQVHDKSVNVLICDMYNLRKNEKFVIIM